MWKEVRHSGIQPKLDPGWSISECGCYGWRTGLRMVRSCACRRWTSPSPRPPVTARGSFIPHVHHFKNSLLSLLARPFDTTLLVLHAAHPPEECPLGNLNIPIWLCQGSCPPHVLTLIEIGPISETLPVHPTAAKTLPNTARLACAHHHTARTATERSIPPLFVLCNANPTGQRPSSNNDR